MAILTTQQRLEAWAGAMDEWSRLREGISGLTKADIRAAIDAIDDWVDGNAASLNAAIPLPARAALTASQKAFLLMVVIGKRFKVGA